MAKNKVKTHTFETYKLLQIIPTDDFLAVYVVDATDGQGKELQAWPVDALGLATVTVRTQRYEDRDGGRVKLHEEEALEENEIVGLELVDGEWCICQENSNFAGFCRKGGDIQKATAHLRADLFVELKLAKVREGA